MMLFDGHDLDDLFLTGEPRLMRHPSSVEYVDVPSRDGRVVLEGGVTFGCPSVTVKVIATGPEWEREEKLSTLGMWLRVDGPRKLVLPIEPDRYYMAVPDGGIEVSRAHGATYGQLTFTITEPAAYGETRSVTVPSGSSVNVRVGGTYPTAPTIEALAERGQSGHWGVRVDDGDFLHVEIPTTAASAVSVDCGARTCEVGGSLTLPTLDSDWLTLEPGTHKISNDLGTGGATVSWIERWL